MNNVKEYILKTFSSEVVGLKDTDYEGLKGTIDCIYGKNERVTENECEVDIVVDFTEGFNSLLTTHPHLNGTSIQQVFCGEDELGFFKHENDEFAFTLEGVAVCPDCARPLDHVTETQYDDISWHWNFETKNYEKKNGFGDSNGKRCPYCNYKIYDDADVFQY